MAHLPSEKLNALTNEKANYLVGWSHGKEILRDGRADKGKGSFYINCRPLGLEKDQTELDRTDGNQQTESRQEETFSGYTAPNIWPSEQDIPSFRSTAENLIAMIVEIAVLVARACDRFASTALDGQDYPAGCLERVVRTSQTSKARLLHYFPPSVNSPSAREARGQQETAAQPNNGEKASDMDQNEPVDDNWCATHLDHGCLTGLTSAMFVNESADTANAKDDTTIIQEFSHSPFPNAGLYIKSRSGSSIKVNIPRDCLAFQTGEALELMTKGKFKAVPHFVRGVDSDDLHASVDDMGGDETTTNRLGKTGSIARNTLAVFTQPNLDEVIDRERELTFGDFARQTVERNTATTTT